MINHFRTRLMNLTDATIEAEYIAPSFTAVSLPSVLSSFRSLIFPSGVRSDVITRANAYTMLLHAYDLDDTFTLYDNRITYTFADLDTFQSALSDIPDIATNVSLSSHTLDMLAYAEHMPKLEAMFDGSPYGLQRLAAAIAAYSHKLQ